MLSVYYVMQTGVCEHVRYVINFFTTINIQDVYILNYIVNFIVVLDK